MVEVDNTPERSALPRAMFVKKILLLSLELSIGFYKFQEFLEFSIEVCMMIPIISFDSIKERRNFYQFWDCAMIPFQQPEQFLSVDVVSRFGQILLTNG